MIPITLSFPPSANSLWRSTGYRVLMSATYRSWKRRALQELMIQRPDKIAGPYRMTMVATRPDNRRRDLSNLVKAVEDALVAAGVVRDDSDCQSLWLAWSTSKPDKTAGVSITLEAA